jgi:type 2 lantibiotic biosynthesis protein LanM
MERLREEGRMEALMLEYPVLARLLVVTIDNWVNFGLEFLTHLCADWDEILSLLSPDSDPGQLVEISGSAGDTHRQGRSVIIAKFSSGFEIVYKPHTLGVDTHYAALLNWLNERGCSPQFRVLKIINRPTHGWTEFIHAKGCETADEVNRFYQRQGAHLALLYMLEATDFHLENLIACGEHPMMVDLEALFHPRTAYADNIERNSNLLAQEKMGLSVLRVGLLPQKAWVGAKGEEGVDLSGLGGAPGQLTPIGVLTWENMGTDEMRAVRKRLEIPASQNRPNLNGRDVNALDHTGAIIEGFTTTYELLIKHRDELISEASPVRAFAGDEVRAVLRPTRIYATLLNESYHPDVLRHAFDRDRLFDRLWVGLDQTPDMIRVVQSETHDLSLGDIPLFSTRPDSTNIWSSTEELIPDFFRETSWSAVQRRLQQLDMDDLARQVWFIRASLTTLTLGQGQDSYTGTHLQPVALPADGERLIAAARAVGDRLHWLAIREEGIAAWIGVTLVNEKFWTLTPLGGDLYGGATGIALYLAYLGDITGEEKYTELARVVIKSFADQLSQLRTQGEALNGSVGGFGGWGGIIYTFTHAGVLWNDSYLLDEAERLADQLPAVIEQDTTLDIIGGVAGGLCALLALYRVRPSARVLEVATLCGDKLLTTAQRTEHGIGWSTTIESSQPLCGFSHGAAGMALALLQLWELSGKPQFKQAAHEAMAYERSVFAAEQANWPDFRIIEGKPAALALDGTFMSAWCHGAPGVGLGRLYSQSYSNDPKIQDEIDTAIATTLKAGFGSNHSLCHGDLGNLELLHAASLKYQDASLRERVDEIASSIVDSISKYGWLCGVPNGVETPGLMTGLAGIGYGLLRLAAPERVPSILVMEAPFAVSQDVENTAGQSASAA